MQGNKYEIALAQITASLGKSKNSLAFAQMSVKLMNKPLVPCFWRLRQKNILSSCRRCGCGCDVYNWTGSYGNALSNMILWTGSSKSKQVGTIFASWSQSSFVILCAKTAPTTPELVAASTHKYFSAFSLMRLQNARPLLCAELQLWVKELWSWWKDFVFQTSQRRFPAIEWVE